MEPADALFERQEHFEILITIMLGVYILPLEERAEAFSTSNAYAGTYILEDGRMIHRVEVSPNPDWVGAINCVTRK